MRAFISLWNPLAGERLPSHVSIMTEDALWQFDAKVRWPGVKYPGCYWDEMLIDEDELVWDGGRQVLFRGFSGGAKKRLRLWLSAAGVTELWTWDVCRSFGAIMAMGLHRTGIMDMRSVIIAAGGDLKLANITADTLAAYHFDKQQPGKRSYKGVLLIKKYVTHEKGNRKVADRHALQSGEDGGGH